jgi:hypothetical protein
MSTHSPEACVEATNPAEPENHFDRFDLLLLPAFFRAMATACFCGLPAFISVLMFELIVFREEPFLRGIETFSFSARTDPSKQE